MNTQKIVEPIVAKAVEKFKTVKPLVSKTQLAYIWDCSENLIQDWEIVELNEALKKADITNKPRICHFLSQISHESGGGRYTKELASGEDYEFRDDLGNYYEGDGVKFKGAGYIQLTGRANYQEFSDYMKDPKIMDGVDYVSKTYPMGSASFWWYNNDMNDLVDSGASVEDVTLRVNGGYNGLDDRLWYYQRCLDILQ
jgi:putative chitinase